MTRSACWLAWQGQDELLAALRKIQVVGIGPGKGAAATRFARPVMDVTAWPLEECLDGFWSPGLSLARLRALATAPDAAAPTCCCARSYRRRRRSVGKTWLPHWPSPTSSSPRTTQSQVRPAVHRNGGG